MTVYAIALLNILDRERYGTYQQGFMEIFSIAASCWQRVWAQSSHRSTWPPRAAVRQLSIADMTLSCQIASNADPRYRGQGRPY